MVASLSGFRSLKAGPDEEGIETSTRAGCRRGRPARSLEDNPDDEGIETNWHLVPNALGTLPLKAGPDEEGIETSSP